MSGQRGDRFTVAPQLWQKLRLNDYDMLTFSLKSSFKTLSKWVKRCAKIPQPHRSSSMLSKIIRLVRKLIAEVSGGLVLMAVVIGVFLAATLNEGAMRIIAPLLVLIAGLVVYGLTYLIASKADRR